MHGQSSIEVICGSARREVDTLSRRGLVTSGMRELLLGWIGAIEKHGRSLMAFSPEERARAGPPLINSILELEAVVKAITAGRKSPSKIIQGALLESTSRILGDGFDVDLLVIVSPVRDTSLKCRIRLDKKGVSLILSLSPVFDYGRMPLLPRVVHEAAHADPLVLKLATGVDIHRIRLAEVSCDMLALLLAGPAFLASAVALMNRLGAQVAQRVGRSHPSLAARASILETLASRLWHGTRVAAPIKKMLDGLVATGCGSAELQEQELLRTEALELLPKYEEIQTDASIWESIYSDLDFSRQSSILVWMNVEVARGRI